MDTGPPATEPRHLSPRSACNFLVRDSSLLPSEKNGIYMAININGVGLLMHG